MKRCNVCNQIKSTSDFWIRRDLKDGLHPHCKSCGNIIQAKRRRLHDPGIVERENKKHYLPGMKRCTICSLSIDRINSDKPYDRDNVRLICYCINNFRGRMSDTELFDVLSRFYEFHSASIGCIGLLSEAA